MPEPRTPPASEAHSRVGSWKMLLSLEGCVMVTVVFILSVFKFELFLDGCERCGLALHLAPRCLLPRAVRARKLACFRGGV